MSHFSKVSEESNKHKNPENIVFGYGTAGFRTKGHVLDGVVFRMGCLAALRSQSKKGKSIGIMVTASHNPEEDNGLKLVDPDGEMLAPAWEGYATELANSTTGESIVEVLEKVAKKENIDLSIQANVIVGRDTRPSSLLLIASVTDGLKSVNSNVVDLGEVSTPQLHFAVRRGNRGLAGDEETYFKVFSDSFKNSLGNKKSNQKLIIDGSNGIGAPKAKRFAELLKDVIEIEVINSEGKLNHLVGADFVKVNQKIPGGVNVDTDRNKKFASVDGDADRVIYYYLDGSGVFHMLDGDKIATLSAIYIRELLQKVQGKIDLKMGVVQTAYANGASTKYLEEVMKIEVACVPTGVKHLHHKAAEYDIGVYFEANGHGTVTFKEEAVTKLQNLQKEWKNNDKITSEEKEALDQLVNLPELINQSVGDAISDILFVESILVNKNWNLEQWDALYKDFPNRLKAQKVKDRNVFKTVNAERELTEPKGMQQTLNQIVSKFKNGRSFVRPSGTEDVVRVYSEADTQSDADTLAEEVIQLVLSS